MGGRKGTYIDLAIGECQRVVSTANDSVDLEGQIELTRFISIFGIPESELPIFIASPI